MWAPRSRVVLPALLCLLLAACVSRPSGSVRASSSSSTPPSTADTSAPSSAPAGPEALVATALNQLDLR